MRIAILTSSLPPYPTGGAEQQAWQTARQLAARGHRVTVFARKMLPHTPRVETVDGVTWVRCPVIRFPGLSLVSHVISFLIAWLRHGWRQTDVILAYQLFINGFLGGLVRGRLPLVSWIRSESEIRIRKSIKFRILSPLVLNRSTLVLVQARALENELLYQWASLRGGFSPDRLALKIRVLSNAIQIGPEPSYDEREGIVFLGRLVWDKGMHYLIQALRLMAQPPPLRILGDGPLRDDLERKAAGLPVIFEGHVPFAEVRNRIASARLLVAPSVTEGFPNAVLEAMERGVPAVASDVGGIHDVVRDGETGFLVPARDPEKLAERMQQILSDSTLWLKLARGARAAAPAYGWESHLERLEALLARD